MTIISQLLRYLVRIVSLSRQLPLVQSSNGRVEPESFFDL